METVVSTNEVDQKNIPNLSSPRKPLSKKIFKIILWFFVVVIFIIVLLFSLPTILNLFSEDIPPPDAPDLALSVVSIPANDNSFYDLQKLDDALAISEEESVLMKESLEGKRWDDAAIAKLLSNNDTALAYFESASKKKIYQDPALSDPSTFSMNTVFAFMSPFIRAGELSALKALYLAKRGNVKAAVEQSFQNLSVALQIEHGQGALLQYLVSLAMKSRGFFTIQNIINHNDILADVLKNLDSRIGVYYDTGDGLKQAFKAEFITRSSTLDLLADGIPRELVENIGTGTDKENELFLRMINGKSKNFYFQPNKTKEYDIEYTRALIKRADQLCLNLGESSQKKLAPNLSPFVLLITENAVGKILHDVVLSSLDSVFNHRCSNNFMVSASKILAAIRSYKNDTGDYPSVLSDLVPIYLDRVPGDPYSGDEMKYSVAKKVIYSVGKKGIDVGGSVGDIIRNMDNPTVNINF